MATWRRCGRGKLCRVRHTQADNQADDEFCVGVAGRACPSGPADGYGPVRWDRESSVIE